LDQGFVIVFDNEKCLVFAGLNHVVVHGVRELGIAMYPYIMDDPQFPICAMEFSFLVDLWHKCFEHLNHHNIRFLGKQQFR